METILQGVKVADFSWAYVGPLTAKTLADCGAHVIKIEGRNRPDVERASVPPFKDNILGLNRGGHFNSVNTGKQSLAINLAHPKGKDVAKRLVVWADVVVENFSGGTMERIGLGYDVLKQIKPDIIMLSSSMQGQTGPDATRAGFGQHLTSFSGIGNLVGWPDRDPAQIGYYTDFIAPHFNITLIAAALVYRRRTGKGIYIDASQFEDCVHFLGPLLLDYQVNGRVAGRMGNRSSTACPHGAFRCQGDDRWCAFAVQTEAQWQAFCVAIGDPAWARTSRFATLRNRKENEDEMERLIECWTVERQAEDVMLLLQKAGVPAGVLQTGEDLLERDPQMKARHFYRELDHPEVGGYRSPRPPYLFSRCDFDVRRAPLIGEHNEYVLKELLGMSDEEIAELVVAGVLE
ncbi:MAG: CoA transferase [Bacillota bacterium]|nr:CoA transferase [Bacillota bacterium]